MLPYGCLRCIQGWFRTNICQGKYFSGGPSEPPSGTNTAARYGCSLMGVKPRGGTRILVLYTCATRETRKKGCFLILNAILENHDKGSKSVCFQEKGSFFYSIRGRLGVICQIPLFHQTYSTKKPCLGGKIGCKIARKFLFRGVFPQKGKSRLGDILKTSGHACVQN